MVAVICSYPHVHPRASYVKSTISCIWFVCPQSRKLGPGMYHVDKQGFHPQAVDERASGPGWARQYEVERMAALPHLLHKDQWLERQMLVRIISKIMTSSIINFDCNNSYNF